MAAARGSDAVELEGVRLTHPDKLLWPEDEISKADLARYQLDVADAMLPHLRDRPLTLVRCPEGTAGGCFYQKHATGRQPASIELIMLREEKGRGSYMTVRDRAGLVALAQMGALELHVWGCRRDQPERPDRMVFDLDPDPSVGFDAVMDAARALRERLLGFDLASFVMTTGGKGLHVVVPLQRRHDFTEVKAFSHAVALAIEREAPDRFIAQMSKARRKGRIFVDYLRNGRGATAVCPFSTRARTGAPVATPLAWTELRPPLTADRFKLRDVPRRLARQRSDPWKGYEQAAGRLTASAMKAVRAR